MKKRAEYIAELKKPYSREKSWTHCYLAFRNAHENKDTSDTTIDYLALHLSTYLSSWGMYRGSSFLFKYTDYKVHLDVVKMILDPQYDSLWQIQDTSEANLLWKLTQKIKKHYENVRDLVGVPGTATQTLLTKILLGTLGCIPAYDEKLCKSLRAFGDNSTFREDSLPGMLCIYRKNKDEIDIWHSEMSKAENVENYPLMRAVDAYLWHMQ